MTDKPNMARITERIKALLNISRDRGASETEAETAARQAQLMLVKYNLSLQDVTDNSPSDRTFTGESVGVTESRPWRRRIAVATAMMYFCKYFYASVYKSRKTGKMYYFAPKDYKGKTIPYQRYDQHNFIGEKHNIAVASMMFEYLVHTVTRLSHQAAKVVQEDRSSFITSFQWACANRLANRILIRIEEAKKGHMKDSDGRNLPAVLNLYDEAEEKAKAFMDSVDGGNFIYRKSNTTMTNEAGVRAGLAAGDQIGLDPQINNNDKPGSRIAPTHLLPSK